MLDKVKLALRINHSILDEEIKETIETARAEMIRAGVSDSKVNDDKDKLIIQAIKTYCLYIYSNDTKMQDGYFKSWEYQLDCLRKSSPYNSEVVQNV